MYYNNYVGLTHVHVYSTKYEIEYLIVLKQKYIYEISFKVVYAYVHMYVYTVRRQIINT